MYLLCYTRIDAIGWDCSTARRDSPWVSKTMNQSEQALTSATANYTKCEGASRRHQIYHSTFAKDICHLVTVLLQLGHTLSFMKTVFMANQLLRCVHILVACKCMKMLQATTQLLSIERADWTNLHDMFKARGGKTWQRKFSVSIPVRVCTLNLFSINIFSRYCCSYRKWMCD